MLSFLHGLVLSDFSENAITFRLLFWTDVLLWFQVKSDVIPAASECFKKNGIEIPFPQLDVLRERLKIARDRLV